jgi:hypothetical protein
MAETGIKDLFALYHACIRKNGSKAETVRLRGKWVQIDPRDWKERNDMTINVGLGNGGKAEELQNHMIIVNAQTQALTNGLTNLVSVQNLYNSAKKLVKITGGKNVDEYFTDPSTQPPLQPKPDPKMIELQGKQQLEQKIADNDAQHQTMKAQADMALADKKFELETKIKMMDAAQRTEAHNQTMEAQRMKTATHVVSSMIPTGGEGQGSAPHPAMLQLVDHFAKAQATPKAKGMRIVRDVQGRVSHAVPIE